LFEDHGKAAEPVTVLGPAEIEAALRRGWLGEQERRRDLAVDGGSHRCVVQRPELLDQATGRRRVGDIGFGDDNAVGEGHLLFGLGHPLDIALTVDGVHDRDERLQMKLAAEPTIGGKSLQYGTRIGEPRGLDHYPLETRHRAACPIGEEPPQRLL